MSTFSGDIGRDEEDGGGWGGLVPDKGERECLAASGHAEPASRDHETEMRLAREKWWSNLSRQGDPLHLTNLFKAFRAGFDAGRETQ